MDQRDSIILTPKNVQASRKHVQCFLQLYHDPLLFFTYIYTCFILNPGIKDTF